MNNAQLINQTSGKTEWYTPIEIVDLARRVMGSIDLDPASSYLANGNIKARRIFTKEGNGLEQEWFGNVWMNPPFSRKDNPLWVNKLASEYNAGNIDQACCITYASTSEKWFRPLLDFPICFIHGRTNYVDPLTGKKAKGVTKGSCVTYLPLDEYSVKSFIVHFSEIGSIMLPEGKVTNFYV